MSIETDSPSTTVCLVALPESSAAVIYGLHEVFASVGMAWEMLTGQRRPARAMSPRIVAATKAPFASSLGVPLNPDATFEETSGSAIVIVPDLALTEVADIPGMGGEARRWLRREFDAGAVVCSVCTGSVLLAAAGLLDGRDATSHWSACPIFEREFPKVRLHPERILVPAGPDQRIITSGGSASWTELALYLVARFSGEAEARRTAKLFLFGDRTDGQLPFAMLARPRQHADRQVSDCQAWIASNYSAPKPVESMIQQSGLPARTFARRFKRATGYTPIAYVQTLRVEEAKQMLEATDEPVETISGEVGYSDEAAFRRLFKRLTGISPGRYRQKFRLARWRPARQALAE